MNPKCSFNYLKLHNLSEMIRFRLDDVEAHIYFGDHLATDLLSYRNQNQNLYIDIIEEDQASSLQWKENYGLAHLAIDIDKANTSKMSRSMIPPRVPDTM